MADEADTDNQASADDLPPADDAAQTPSPPAELDLSHLVPVFDQAVVDQAADDGAIKADAQGDPVLTNGKPEWSPPPVDEESGIALDGHNLPMNHRLRAETLVGQGKTTDPAGEITDDLIAATKTRLAAEAAAAPKGS